MGMLLTGLGNGASREEEERRLQRQHDIVPKDLLAGTRSVPTQVCRHSRERVNQNCAPDTGPDDGASHED